MGSLTPSFQHPIRDAVTITVIGEPQAKGRARTATVNDGKGGVRMVTGKTGKRRPMLIHHTPKTTRQYEQAIRFEATRAMSAQIAFSGPLRLTLVIVMGIPRSWPRWKRELAERGLLHPTGKPDADNVEKAIKDALNGIVWHDDSQVVECDKIQMYQCRLYPQPAIHATVSLLPGFPSSITKKPEIDHVE